jgi:hypothetical protein
MIYLFDDKVIRQREDYNWTKERFDLFSDHILPIYSLKDVNLDDILKEGNVILYHESFVDETDDKDQSVNIRNYIGTMAEENDFYVVYFSGSMSNRQIDNQIASLPVSLLYMNLEIFIKKTIEGDLDLKYVLFGLNYEVEHRLSANLDFAWREAIKETKILTNNKVILFRPVDRWIDEPFDVFTEFKLYDNSSEYELTKLIDEALNNEVYDNIFIPISYGSILSDFRGLQLAAHLRCTRCKNQLSRIFIYSYANLSDLVNSEYFNILKTKNVYLIDYSKSAFSKALNYPIISYDDAELRNELKKLKLDRPNNYYDDHSIANEWGLLQMVRNANVDVSKIEGFDITKLDSLYFKWLMTINGLHDPLPLDQVEKQKEYIDKFEIKREILSGPKVLYKIDLPKK